MSKTKNLKPFKELALRGLVRLDLFGGAHKNYDEFDNLLLECVFTPINKDNLNGVITLSPKYEDQFKVNLAIGYLPVLNLGQYYQDGILTDEYNAKELVEIEVKIDVSDIQLVRDTSLSEHSIKILQTIKYSPLRSNSKFKLLLAAAPTNQYLKHKGLINILISEYELIRYYLTNSSYSCKNLFYGAFSNQEIDKKVYLKDKSDFNKQTKHAYLIYRREYSVHDAPVLARIIFEPNGLGLKAAQRVSNSLVSQNVNGSSSMRGSPRTAFPFSGNTRLKLKGQIVEDKMKYYFIAHKIESCNAKFPFDELTYSSENGIGGNSTISTDLPNFPGANKLIKSDAHSNDLGHSRSDQPPLFNSLPITVELGIRNYPGLNLKGLHHVKIIDDLRATSSKFVIKIPGYVDASTGSGTSSKTTAVKQSLNEQLINPEKCSNLEVFIQALNHLISDPDFKFKTLAIGQNTFDNGISISKFPRLKWKKKKIDHVFSFNDDSKTIQKSFVCAEIQFQQKYLYLFESERRLTKSNSTEYMDALPILIVWNKQFSEKNPEDFKDLIDITIKLGTWPNTDRKVLASYPNIMMNLIKDTIPHTTAIADFEGLATKINNLIKIIVARKVII